MAGMPFGALVAVITMWFTLTTRNTMALSGDLMEM
jgi:hypothetical protein